MVPLLSREWQPEMKPYTNPPNEIFKYQFLFCANWHFSCTLSELSHRLLISTQYLMLVYIFRWISIRYHVCRITMFRRIYQDSISKIGERSDVNREIRSFFLAALVFWHNFYCGGLVSFPISRAFECYHYCFTSTG